MPKARKKTLPKNFEDLLAQGDIAALKAVFATCDVDARGGYAKQTALAFDDCPDELARWLVAEGADLSAADTWGNTPLHARARSSQGRIDVLLALGADVHAAKTSAGTPLHCAADSGKDANVRLLIEAGADVDARNADGHTPLEYALRRCQNAGLARTVAVAECLIAAGAARTPAMTGLVETIGKTFEFHREHFNPETRDEASAALDRLYRLFDVTPVPRRTQHDGVSPIRVPDAPWPRQHEALWALLVPSSGAAATVQGEVVRITGRISDELERNGGANWDADYRRMADALAAFFRTGAALPAAELDEADRLVAQVKKQTGDHARLAALAVAWVARNPAPMALAPPDYKR